MSFLNAKSKTRLLSLLLLASCALSTGLSAEAEKPAKWWDEKFPVRKKITVDTSSKGLSISDPIGSSALLIRLSDSVFNFMGAKEDGSDLRFVADDQKTLLKHHIEKWDGLLNEAYVWVQVPDLKPSEAATIWLYYGNVTDAANVADAKGTYDADTVLVYHFGEAATVGVDSSASGISAQDASPPTPGGVISNGQRLLGQKPVTVPENPILEWAAGSSLTWAAWIKPTALQDNAVIFSRRDGTNAFLIGIDKGVPFVEINKQRSSGGAAVAPLVWSHVAVVAKEGTVTVYLNGVSYGTLAAAIPAIKGAALIGKDSAAGSVAYVGEIDEVQISKVARPAGWVKFAAISQGNSSDVAKLVTVGNDENSAAEAAGELTKQLMMIKDISKDLTLDGWVVIGLCCILAVIGWGVAIAKLLYLNKINKATKLFVDRWKQISSDLTALDSEDEETVKSMGGTASGKAQKLMRHSPLFHIYQMGSFEIRQRLQTVRGISLGTKERVSRGLSGRSIQAIKATLHGGLMREVQKLNSQLVFLTIGIAGGPYLGLLGTVIGVMITFATIAKSGQVEVNSIAPGIAGALLATVAGLAVAIPALFAYSYLSSRIKDSVTDMETFIDEFLARMAEHHKEVSN
jgi:biopolymer transport protein ExbB